MDYSKTAYENIRMTLNEYMGAATAAMTSNWLPSSPLDVDAAVYEELGARTFYSYMSDDNTMTLSDFIGELNELAALAPEGSEVVIEMSSESDYDGPSNPRYEVGYFRDPTEEEMAERREANRKIAERDKLRAEQAAAKERETYEHLKSKFER